MVFKKFIRGFMLASISVLAGCASASIVSSKDQAYGKMPTQLAILSDLGRESGDSLGRNLPEAMKKDLAACGVEVSIDQMSDLSFGPQNISMTHPDALMFIRWKNAAANGYGAVVQAEYHFEMTDFASKKVVWKANMQFHPGRYGLGSAEVFTRGLMERLKADGILSPSCTLPAVQ